MPTLTARNMVLTFVNMSAEAANGDMARA